jgi:inorganic triphosphatase YgiF
MTDDPPTAAPPAPAGLAAEIELKFEVTPADIKRLSRHPALAGKGKVLALTSAYYDSPDLSLRDAGLTLRVRKAGGKLVQTVKRGRPTDLFNRDEWESPVKRLTPDLTALAATPAGKLAEDLGDALACAFTTAVRRTTRLWVKDETVVEIAVDRGAVSAGDDKDAICELELELKTGDPHVLYDLARALFAIAPVRLSLTSKSERGYRLIRPGLAGKASRPALEPSMTVAQAFAAVARSCLMQITDAADAFHRRPGPEGVHQTRVGLRRLRTALKLFKTAVADDRRAWIDGEVRWLTGELGPARSLDVFLEDTFTPARPDLSDPEAAGRYATRLDQARKTAYGRAGAAIASPRFAAFALELALWVEQGAWRHAEAPAQRALQDSAIGPFAIDALDDLRHVVRKRGKGLKALDTEHRHHLRIRAKRLRYATSFFADALGEDGDKKRRKFSAALKALQDQLGKLNDIAQAHDSALAALDGRPAAAALTFTAGELTGWARSHEPKVLAKAVKAYTDFTHTDRFWPKSGKLKVDEADEEQPVSE